MNKLLSTFLAGLTIISFWFVNNNWRYPAFENIPVIKKEDLTYSNIAKTYIMKGSIVGKDIVGKDIHTFRIQSLNQDFEVGTTIWPAIGNYFHPSENNPIEIIGALSKYNGIWQVNPLSSKHISSDIDNINLIDALGLQDEYVENIGPVNIVYKKKRARSGKMNLHLLIYDSSTLVSGIMYEGKYDESLLKKIDTNSSFYLDAEVGEYNNKPSLQVESIEESNEELENDLDNYAYNINESYQFEGTNEYVIIGPLTGISSKLSKSKEHLIFTAKQENRVVDGIFFGNDWNSKTRYILDNKSFYLRSKVTTFNNKISLESDWIISSE